MTAPSNANTSGLEVVAYSWEQHIAGAHWSWRLDRHQPNHSPEKRNPSIRSYEPLVTAASAQAEREARLAAEARADRLAKVLERIAITPSGMAGLSLSDCISEARAALQREG